MRRTTIADCLWTTAACGNQPSVGGSGLPRRAARRSAARRAVPKSMVVLAERVGSNIARMTRDLNLPVKLVFAPTVREPDGLALSSRNVYLSPEERAQAPSLRRGLLRVEVTMEDGSVAYIERDLERGILVTRYDGHVTVPDGVTRAHKRSIDQLIVRELKDPSSDRLLLKVLPVTVELAKRVR